MRTVYRFRAERHYDKQPGTIWPLLADTARVNELVGFAPYRFEEKLDTWPCSSVCEGQTRADAIALGGKCRRMAVSRCRN